MRRQDRLICDGTMNPLHVDVMRTRSFYLLSALIIFYASVIGLGIVLSLMGPLLTQPVCIGILLVSAVAAALNHLLLPRSTRTSKNEPLSKAATLVVGAAALLYAGLLFTAWMKPDLTWDANTAHIPTVHFWALENRVHWISLDPSSWAQTADVTYNAAPRSALVFMLVFLKATQLHPLLNGVNVVFLPLGVLSVYCAARAMGARRTPSAVAASLYLMVPLNVSQASTTYMDSATASVFTAFMFISALVFTAFARRATPWFLLPLLGASMGLALGVKSTGYIMAPLGAMLLTGRAAWSWGRDMLEAKAWRLPRRRLRANAFLPRSAVFLAATALIVIFVGSYWNFRNLYNTGNPVFPARISVGEAEVAEGVDAEDLGRSAMIPGTQEWSHSYRVLHSWFQGFQAWAAEVRIHDSRVAGLGYTWLIASLPAAALVGGFLFLNRALVRRGQRRRREALFHAFLALLLLAAITFALRPWNNWPRHVLFIQGFGLAAFGIALSMLLLSGKKLVRWSGIVWAAAAVLIAGYEAFHIYSFWSSACYTPWTNKIYTVPITPDWSEKPWRAARALVWHDPAGYLFPSLSGTDYEEILANPEPLAFMSFVDSVTLNLIGQLGQPIGERPLHFVSWRAAHDEELLRSFLRERNIRYVMHDNMAGPLPVLNSIALSRQHAGYFQIYKMPDWEQEGDTESPPRQMAEAEGG